MIYIIYSIIAIVALSLFMPDIAGGEIKNLPLLIAILSIIVLLLIIRFIKYVLVFFKARALLRKNGYEILKCNILPPALRLKKECHIIAKKDSKTINIFVLFVRKAYLTYHFENMNTLELYKSTRLAIKPRARQASIISSKVEKKRVCRKKLYLKNNTSDSMSILLFNKLPSMITDSLHRDGLWNGDKICGRVTLYSLDSFERLLKSNSPQN